MRKLVSRHSIEIKSWFTYGIFICTIMFLSYRNVLLNVKMTTILMGIKLMKIFR